MLIASLFYDLLLVFNKIIKIVSQLIIIRLTHSPKQINCCNLRVYKSDNLGFFYTFLLLTFSILLHINIKKYIITIFCYIFIM